MRLLLVPTLSLLAIILSNCDAPNAANLSSSSFPIAAPSGSQVDKYGPPKTGPGKVLSSAYGGQILGFDIDQDGMDGLLTESLTQGNKLKSAVETFDITTAKITKIVKVMVSSPNDDFVTFGIVGEDVGFVDEQRVSFDDTSRDDVFFLLNPVKNEKITGRWKPPHIADSVLYQQAENQTTNTQVSVVFRNAFSRTPLGSTSGIVRPINSNASFA